MIAEVVLAELARAVAEVEQELGKRRRAGRRYEMAPGNCGRTMPARYGCMPVMNAERPAVQLDSA